MFEEFPNAYKWERPLDPSSIGAYVAHFGGSNPLLEEAEVITEPFQVTLSDNALLQGLVLGTDEYAPTLYDGSKAIKIWLKVDPAQQDNPLFSGDGLWLPVTFHVVTNLVPPNIYDRTAAVNVRQQ